MYLRKPSTPHTPHPTPHTCPVGRRGITVVVAITQLPDGRPLQQRPGSRHQSGHEMLWGRAVGARRPPTDSPCAQTQEMTLQWTWSRRGNGRHRRGTEPQHVDEGRGRDGGGRRESASPPSSAAGEASQDVPRDIPAGMRRLRLACPRGRPAVGDVTVRWGSETPTPRTRPQDTL